jgi:predicted ATPase/DNA-binding winged helix-turn-helix (wHTH) protein
MTIPAFQYRFHRSAEPHRPPPLFEALHSSCQADSNQRMSNSVTRYDGAGGRAISFGQFRLYPTQRQLLKVDKPVRIGSRALDILIMLVERPGQLLSKDELMARVWPGTFVEPANLTVHIAALRRVLSDGREGARYLVNVHGRGYRFVAPVSRGEDDSLVRTERVVPQRNHNLPTQITRLVGRAETVAVLAEQLSHDRLLTIVGPGGIGKTSVALAVAERTVSNYEHGIWLVDLASASNADAVASVVATAVGLESSSNYPIVALVESLRENDMLLLFDNCEHVVDTAASVAVSILRGAPKVRILATSREPLRAEGEHRHRLEPLEVPSRSVLLSATDALRFSAVELFVDRAAAKLNGFELSERDVPIVVDLCRKLDGNALAIELAAGRIDTFGLRGLSTRLDGGLRQLTGGNRTALPRHQTLQAMLDWSFDWLLVPERIVLSRLAIFNGEFTLEAASAVASSEDIPVFDVADLVVGLVTKSLVAADICGKEPQYHLLEITRAYAREKLQESGEFELIARRHAEYMRDTKERKNATRERAKDVD